MKASLFLFSQIYNAVGGAEKRFFGLWLNMQKRGINCRLVTFEKMLDVLSATNEFKDFGKYAHNISIVSQYSKSEVEMSKMLRRYASENLSHNEVMHFVMYYPYFLKLPNPVLLSDTAASLQYFNTKGKILNLSMILRAKTVDILDPERGENLKKLFFWNKHKINITSNTFVNAEIYQAQKMNEKKNWLVFLGRFEYMKQVVAFTRAIPHIDKTMKASGINDGKFFILGDGTQEQILTEMIKKPEYREIDIEFGYNPQPSEILRQAKIFFSLQKVTNYPSKSLAEALACGCLPIVTDNGSTRRMAQSEFSYYVPENFESEILASKVSEILALTPNELQKKSDAAHNFASKELTLDKMTDYYLSLYQSLYDSRK